MTKRMTINNLSGKSAEVLLYDEIGGWFGVDAKQFAQDIADLDVDDLTVRVHSPGGDVWDGLAIMNSLKRHKAKVTIVVEGIAASAASFIAVGAADELVMSPHSELMIHDAMTFAAGNVADLEAVIEHLNRESDNVAAIYAARAGGVVEQWRDAMREESWYSASEAVAAGLADRIDDAEDTADVTAFVGSRVFANFKFGSRREAPRPPIPKNERGEKMTFLNDVAQRLGLATDDLDEKTVMAALEETLAEQAEEPTEGVEAVTDPADVVPGGEVPSEVQGTDAGEATSQVEDPLTVEIDAARLEELEAAEAALKEAYAREQEQEAELIAAQAVEDGKIGAAAQARWVTAIKADPEDAKARLENMRKGLVHRSETGHVTEPDAVEDGQEKLAMQKAFGLHY